MSEDRRSGLVIIVFVGSVFSPFYARARLRNGGVADPMGYCAFNVALYRRFRSRWVFTERPAASVLRTADELTIGSSTIAWQDGTLIAQFDEKTAPWGGRLRGRVRLTPLSVPDPAHSPQRLDTDGRHRWWPCAPVAQAEVTLERPRMSFRGTAYHDSNEGDEPLEKGFSRWTWSRAELSRGTGVLYDSVEPGREPLQRGWLFQRDGTVSPLEAPGRSWLRPGLWLIGRHTRHDAGARARIAWTWEDAPFYTRELVRTQLAGEKTMMVHETLDLRRFDSPWVRWMLPYRMRRELVAKQPMPLLTAGKKRPER
jgi:carotenoid 1,2-hydratase